MASRNLVYSIIILIIIVISYIIHAQNGRTALSLASLKGHPDVTEVLVEAGASTDIQDEVNKQLVAILILSLLYNMTFMHTQNGRTALSLASLKGHLDVTEVLVEAGASTDTQDEVNKQFVAIKTM